MKTVISSVASFNPVNKTIDLSNIAGFDISKLYVIINITRSQPIYLMGKAGYGFTSVVGSEVTLAFDTTTYQANDKFSIIYDGDADLTNLGQIVSLLAEIKAELKDDFLVESFLWEDRSGQTPIFYREERKFSQDDGTVSTFYTRLDTGNTVSSLPVGSIPVDNVSDRQVENVRWKVKAASSGTGYSALDYLIQTQIVSTSGSGSVVGVFWYNLTTSQAIAAPNTAHIEGSEAALLVAVNSLVAKVPDPINARTPVTNRDGLELIGTYNSNVSNALVASVDVSAYREILMILTGTFSGYVGPYFSLDGATNLGNQLMAYRVDTIAVGSSFGALNPGAYKYPVKSPFMRFFTGPMSGTVTVSLYGVRVPSSEVFQQVVLMNSLQPGSSNIGNVGLLAGTQTIGGVNLNAGNNTLGYVKLPAATPGKLVAVAGTNAAILRNSAGVLTGLQLSNTDTVPVYCKLYNKSTAPIVGTDVPIRTLLIPANPAGGGNNPTLLYPINFSVGIAMALTLLASDVDTSAVGASGAGKIIVNYDHSAA